MVPLATIKAATTLATVCPVSKGRNVSSTSTTAPTILVTTAELVTIRSTGFTVPVLTEQKDFCAKLTRMIASKALVTTMANASMKSIASPAGKFSLFWTIH